MLQICFVTFEIRNCVFPWRRIMSRTVRALPNNRNGVGSIKRFVGVTWEYPKRYGNCFISENYMGQHGISLSYVIRVSDINIIRVRTEEEQLTIYKKIELYWCKKNKTCRRQRKNAVRKEKQMRSQIRRAKWKQQNLDLIDAAFTDSDYENYSTKIRYDCYALR